jgi:Ca2+-binding EF-hand superfamily protein
MDLSEFYIMLHNIDIKLPLEEVKMAFQIFDLDKSGEVGIEEFRDVVNGTRKSSVTSLYVTQNV